MQYFGLRFTFSPVSRQKLASFCRETAIRRRSNPSLTVGALMVSLKLRDLESEPRPLGSVLTRGNRVSRQKLARVLNLREPEVCCAPERSTFPSRAGASGSHHLPWAESGAPVPCPSFPFGSNGLFWSPVRSWNGRIFFAAS